MATSPTFRSPALPALWRDASSLRLIALVVVAAVALPKYTSAATDAREASALTKLRWIRTQIEV